MSSSSPHRLPLVLLLLGALALPAGAGQGPRRPRGRVQPAPAGPQALHRVGDCQELRDHVSAVVLETVIRHRYGWWRWYGPWSDVGGGDPSAEGPSDYTTTNVQEQGVDELDIVKTDGSYLYVAQDAALNVVRSWPAESSELVATLELEGYASGLFLRDDLVLAISSSWNADFAPDAWGLTRLDLVDVADRTAPAVVRSVEVEGQLVGARLVDGHAYVVVWTYLPMPDQAWELAWRDDLGLPVVDWDAPQEERDAAAAVAREILRPLVAEIVNGLAMDELLPLVRDRSAADPDAAATPLLDCAEVYLPAEASQLSALSVLHLDLDQPGGGPLDATAILADGYTLYASSRSLYVAQGSWWWWWGWGDLDRTTVIHRFELAGDRGGEPVRYAATGSVDGWLHNQFSLGEHDGHLRVATTAFDWWWGLDQGEEDRQGSSVTVLRDDQLGRLAKVGEVTGIAPGEQIYAARFIGDVGYLVTFRQVDPLFTLDLSEPTAPRVVGELETPGYSAYLHPVDDGHLLAVGMEADLEGRVIGLQVSLFDVSDLAQPRLQDRYLVEGSPEAWSWSEALWDHHAFTFHRGVLSIPAYIMEPGHEFTGLIAFSVDTSSGIGELGRVDHQDLPGRDTWPQVRRSVYVEDALFSLSSRGLKVNRLTEPEVELSRVPLPQTWP